MSTKLTEMAAEVAGKSFDPAEKEKEHTTTGLEVTHEQIGDHYAAGTIDQSIKAKNGE
ncbi:YozQ family protein [Bacillus sp. SJS]|uniref:YozQ family protein n=1 Tax=Bacillus sp. SJS TaxID=1423321 RepID=UPI000A6CF393|nr:YozQ family protein [Bacillus sp. SJS]